MAGEIRKVTPSVQQVGARVLFGPPTSAFPSLKRSGAQLQVRLADDSTNSDLTAGSITAFTNTTSVGASVTQGSGAGIGVAFNGLLQRAVYKATVTKDAFVSAALTADVTVATLPAKTALLACYCDTTAAFGGLAGTITVMVGVGATPNTYIVAHDVKSAPITKGLADADLGVSLNRATAVQGGKVESFTGTTPVLLRLTSGTGNIGTGAATNLTTGSVTVYLVTERLP